MVKKWNVTIPELTGTQRRKAYIYLPTSYREQRRRRYPVLYMFDGHNVFFDEDATYGKSWGMADYLDYTDTDLIVAAVECSHDPDNGRLKEYSPFNFSEKGIGDIEGKGRLTMDWFVGTFKPYIDSHYRTLPDREHTFIAGSSMGGLMSLYAVLYYNNSFSRAAALSPALWISAKDSEAMIKEAHPAPDTIVYMDFGEAEMGTSLRRRKAYGKICTLLLGKGILLDARIVPGGEHCEASWERQIPFFMNTLLY
ncbi:MAG: alpha/beta hydrolase [Clostridiales bacterium]|nr:alpha/beta hydrolase [Clostridiales bacterium]